MRIKNITTSYRKINNDNIPHMHEVILKLKQYYLTRVMKNIEQFIKVSDNIEDMIAYKTIIHEHKVWAKNFRKCILKKIQELQEDIINNSNVKS